MDLKISFLVEFCFRWTYPVRPKIMENMITSTAAPKRAFLQHYFSPFARSVIFSSVFICFFVVRHSSKKFPEGLCLPDPLGAVFLAAAGGFAGHSSKQFSDEP